MWGFGSLGHIPDEARGLQGAACASTPSGGLLCFLPTLRGTGRVPSPPLYFKLPRFGNFAWNPAAAPRPAACITLCRHPATPRSAPRGFLLKSILLFFFSSRLFLDADCDRRWKRPVGLGCFYARRDYYLGVFKAFYQTVITVPGDGSGQLASSRGGSYNS